MRVFERRPRTTKCGPITREMSMEERLSEYRKLGDDEREIATLYQKEWELLALDLFAEFRRGIIASLPKDLPEREFKRQLYFRTYGEHLPDDYFKDEDENDG